MLPRVLLCGSVEFAQDELKHLLGGIADVVTLSSSTRTEFFASFEPGGPYEGTVAIFRRNVSAQRIGVFDRALIMGLPASVRWIAHNGVGYDQIDLEACRERGIGVSNTPGGESTATVALYLIISCLRHYSAAQRHLLSPELGWRDPEYNYAARAHDPQGRTLAILGLGTIGLSLAHYARPLGMRIVYHSRSKKGADEVPPWCEYVGSLEGLLREADVLSLHVPLNDATRGMLGEREVRMMKRGSVLVNTARGAILDEEAAIRALKDGHLSALGLDVYPNEPNINPRLLAFPQAVLLPHVGGETYDTLRAREIKALTNLRDFLTKGRGEDLVSELRP